MNKALPVIFSSLMGVALSVGVAQGQGSPQAITEMRVDVAQLATGYRASKVIGASVMNSEGEKIGSIDDLIVNPQDKQAYAILSVGGFLGMGSHLVAIPFKSLEIADKKIRFPGASKDSLKAMPEFKYATD